jgi:DNA polymerase III sliding clamp (beta) subunit (PCNA family)
MRINREELLSRLEQVNSGLAKRELVEQSASFVFKDGRIYTFNEEVFCHIEFDSSLTGAVHAKPLTELLNKLTEKDVEIEINKNQLLVKGHNSRAGILMDKEIVLPIDKVETPSKWFELSPEFSDAVEIVQDCASKDASSFKLTCIHITPTYLEACDNLQLIRYSFNTGIEEECLVKRDALKQITGLGMNQVAEANSWLHFRSPSGLQMSCRKWTEAYDDLTGILECEGSKAVLPTGLPEAIEKAGIFSSDGPVDDRIKVELKKGRLRLQGYGPKGSYEERRKAEYDGDPIEFMISPKLLIKITKRTNDCEVAPGKLKVGGDKFTYIACLIEVEY